ncbi:hypothetical protein [Sphingomonas sp. Ant20]|uniref:hypothetical protein n=1 Tax=Sphingomonas sp. Ant20 TaxID=104605 RepID=UPI000538A230|nr:hypothetical protein [Sphingomonas sp. Ant20]KHA63488.1 hypothetical protein NI18_15655 [Sphingomonas sp. Ant20]
MRTLARHRTTTILTHPAMHQAIARQRASAGNRAPIMKRATLAPTADRVRTRPPTASSIEPCRQEKEKNDDYVRWCDEARTDRTRAGNEKP